MLSILNVMKASAGYTKPMRYEEELLRSEVVFSVGKKNNGVINK